MTTNSPEKSLESMLEGVNSLRTTIMSPAEFQRKQTNLKHSIILDNAVVGCRFDEVLVEVLRELKMAIVLDRNTSKSRTSWLAATVSDELVLMVLDSYIRNGITRVSVDLWSDVIDIPKAMLHRIRETSLGDVQENFQAIDVSWYLTKENESNYLIIELSSHEVDERFLNEEILFFVDYQGIMTERFRAGFPIGHERVSVSVELADCYSSYVENLDDAYLSIYISDAEWKPIEKYRRICFSWKDALIHQIKHQLSKGSRLTNFSELANSLNIEDNNESMTVRNLFLDFCKSIDVAGCKNQRVTDHCSRAIILTALVICFNPPRGLTGYLELILTDEKSDSILNLGSERTWREHLSGIANLAQDFRPTAVKLTGSKKDRKPGRPPTQLVPKTPPADLFTKFVGEPDTIVCRLCRFND